MGGGWEESILKENSSKVLSVFFFFYSNYKLSGKLVCLVIGEITKDSRAFIDFGTVALKKPSHLILRI